MVGNFTIKQDILGTSSWDSHTMKCWFNSCHFLKDDLYPSHSSIHLVIPSLEIHQVLCVINMTWASDIMEFQESDILNAKRSSKIRSKNAQQIIKKKSRLTEKLYRLIKEIRSVTKFTWRLYVGGDDIGELPFLPMVKDR